MKETLTSLIFSCKTPLHAVMFFQEAPGVTEHMWVNPLLFFLFVEATERAATERAATTLRLKTNFQPVKRQNKTRLEKKNKETRCGYWYQPSKENTKRQK